MARTLPELGAKLVVEIEAAWAQPRPDWARRRLLVVRLIAQHELTVAEIMRVADVSRQTVFSYRDKVVAEGVAGLLRREWAGARRPLVRGALAEEFTALLEAGRFRRAKDAQAWLKKRTRRTLSVSGVRKVLRKLGSKLKVPRKSHATKKNPTKTEAFKLELPTRLEELAGAAARTGQPVRLWMLDEHRYGLLPVIRRVWAKRGVRVHAPYATRYQWGTAEDAPDKAQRSISWIISVGTARRVGQHPAQLLAQALFGHKSGPRRQFPVRGQTRWSVKPIRMDFTPSLVPKFSRTVWFASARSVNVVVMFTPSTPPNGAPLGDYLFICKRPAELMKGACHRQTQK